MRYKNFLPLLLLVPALLMSCAATGAVQGAAEPYSFEINGQADGLVAANLRFIAVDAQVDLTVRFRKDSEVLWERTFEKGSGRRAYQILFDSEDNFIDIVPVDWDTARTSLRWLPGDFEEEEPEVTPVVEGPVVATP